MLVLLLNLLGPAWAVGAVWTGVALVRGRRKMKGLYLRLCHRWRREASWLGEDGIQAAVFMIVTLGWPLALAAGPLIDRADRKEERWRQVLRDACRERP